MNIKVHVLQLHLDFFPNNLYQPSDEQGDRFNQEIGVNEKRFQRKSGIDMLSDYYWTLKRVTDDALYKRKRSKKHFSVLILNWNTFTEKFLKSKEMVPFVQYFDSLNKVTMPM